MSKLFYDKLISLDKIEKAIALSVESSEEKQELWSLIDEVIHHKVIGCVLSKLHRKYHKEFMVKLYRKPHDDKLLDYLQKKIKIDVSEFIKAEIGSITFEVLESVKHGVKTRNKKFPQKKKGKYG